MSSVLVKICGTTSLDDALLAQDYGADFIGLVIEHAPSPRNLDLQTAIQISRAVSIPVVALTVNKSRDELQRIVGELSPRALQLHGDESADLVAQLSNDGIAVWKALSGDNAAVSSSAKLMQEAGAEAILIDARATQNSQVVYGGTGKLSDWDLARELSHGGAKLILAGGLDASNVADGVRIVAPWAVDAVSGLESSKGRKDAAKVRDFVRAAKNDQNSN